MYVPVHVVCCYRGRVGTDLSVLWHVDLFCFHVVAGVSMVSMAN